jgi:hypothetical protein
MASPRFAPLLGLALGLAACSSAPSSTSTTTSGGHGGSAATTASGSTATGSGGTTATSGSGGAIGGSGGTGGDPPDAGDGGMEAGPPPDSLGENRDRLLASYLAYLQANASQPQSNGLSGSNVGSVCELWQRLAPSAQDVFLTLTARLQGSVLGSDGSSMLSHVTRVYRIAGGQNATATAPGSCGGGEYNRMILSMDAALQRALVAANQHQGAAQGNGKPDLADLPIGGNWRDSHDLGGPHAPFDLSDETKDGAPRGQTQYFRDPGSTKANAPLGRMDLASLVDPYALEMDQDYDCVHNSNPDCTYVAYGPFCALEASAKGTDIYVKTYGSFEPGYRPAGCP